MVIKDLFNFYINSSIHVALAVVSFAIITMLDFNLPINLSICIFIFLGSITGYNIVKYAGIAGLHHLSLTKNLRLIQIFSLIVFICLLVVIFRLPLNAIIFSGVMGLLTLLYVLPFFGGGRNLRGLTGVKIYVIAFVWAGVTVLLPLINNMELLQWDIAITLLQRFMFVIALTLPFEIRDLKFDMAKLNTVPQIFGVGKTKLLGVLILCLVLLMEFLKAQPNVYRVVSLIIITGLLSSLIIRARIRQPKYYSSFWVESVPIIWCFLLVCLKFIA